MAKSRKRKKSSNINAKILSINHFITKQVRNLPINKCYIDTGWEENRQTIILILRKHVNGKYSSAIFDVCLLAEGVKETTYLFNHEIDDLKDIISEGMEICPYSLVHNIIWGVVEYADELGLKPHKDFVKTQYFLEEDADKIEYIDIEFGKSGRPAVVIDNENKNYNVIKTLDDTVGRENYDIINIDEEYDYLDDLPLDFEEIGFDSHEGMIEILLENNSEKEIKEYFEIFFELFEEKKSIDIKNIPENYEDITVARIIETLYFITQSPNIEIEPDWQTLFRQLFFNDIPDSPFDIPDEKITYEPIDLGYNKTNAEEENHLRLLGKINSEKGNIGKDIKKQIRLYPDNPVFKGLLYKWLFEMDKVSEIKETIGDDYEKHADYLFLKLYYGELLLKEKQFENIYEIFNNKTRLDELYPKRKIFHITEFVAFCHFFIKFNIAIEQLETAIQYYNALAKYYVEGNKKLMAYIEYQVLEAKSKILGSLNPSLQKKHTK